MPKQASSLLAKYGSAVQQAIQEHVDDPIDYGIQRVPAGITNGVAQVTKCGFGIYKTGANKGEAYFRCEAMIHEPPSVVVNGVEVPVQGLHTSIMEPVCETKTQGAGGKPPRTITVAEHVASIMNTMKMLGAELSPDDDLEMVAQAIEEARPYTRFSTSVRKALRAGDQDGVWENWYGCKGLEDYVPPDTGDEVDEEAPKAASPKKSTGGPSTKLQANGTPKDPVKKPPAGGKVATKAEEPEEEFSEFGDIDTLAEQADNGDADAQAKILELAEQVSEELKEQVENAESWTEGAALLTAARESDEVEADNNEDSEESSGDEAPDEEEIIPVKGDSLLLTRLDAKGKPEINPKTKKPYKAVQVVVEVVTKKDKTATVRSLENSKEVFKNVRWSQLAQAT